MDQSIPDRAVDINRDQTSSGTDAYLLILGSIERVRFTKGGKLGPVCSDHWMTGKIQE